MLILNKSKMAAMMRASFKDPEAPYFLIDII